MSFKRCFAGASLVLLLAASLPVAADEAESKYHPVIGPSKIDLGDKLAVLNLPAKYAFLNKGEASALLEKTGSGTDGVLGIVLPNKDEKDAGDDSFYIICRFDDCGYVKDDDAGKLNNDEILNSYKDATKEQNEVRKENNIEPIFVGGWAEKPHYEKPLHHVIWALEVKDKEEAASPVTAINYNTRILGRRGVLSMNLVTEPKELQANKAEVATILAATKFAPGQTYEEYQPGKDKDSGFGIGGLILGGGALAAAAKFGVFGALWKWILGLVLVLKKFIVIIVVAVIAGVKKLFGGKKSDTPS